MIEPRPGGPSYREASARGRLTAILDQGSFRELLGPTERVTSPHLAALDLPVAFDDGVVVGTGLLGGQPVLGASQEGRFLGGAVGEVHGAKLTGLLRRALLERPAVVLLLLDTGGVRLQEANAGIVAVSEVLRAVLAVRAAGIQVLALIGGAWGCFGGMGIVARCCDRVLMSEEARMGISGPDVIEATRGVEELDASDRAMVWRTWGGKHRVLLGEADRLVEDSLSAFREATRQELRRPRPLTLAALEAERAWLASRLADLGGSADALDSWRAAGVAEPERLPLLEPADWRAAVAGARRPRP
jgi:malonate decarboxylase beta subunit